MLTTNGYLVFTVLIFLFLLFLVLLSTCDLY